MLFDGLTSSASPSLRVADVGEFVEFVFETTEFVWGFGVSFSLAAPPHPIEKVNAPAINVKIIALFINISFLLFIGSILIVIVFHFVRIGVVLCGWAHYCVNTELVNEYAALMSCIHQQDNP